MQVFKNENEVHLITAMQGEANITTVVFKIPFTDLGLDMPPIMPINKLLEEEPTEVETVDIDDYIAIIEFKDDYLTTIPNTNLKLTNDDTNFIINWEITKAITLDSKERTFQVILKNKKTNKVYKSFKNLLSIQKSFDCECVNNCNCNCDTTCIAGLLEQFSIKINSIIENGVGDFVARAEFTELENKVTKLETNVANVIKEVTENFENTNNKIEDLENQKADKQDFDNFAKLNKDNTFTGVNTFLTEINKPFKIVAPLNKQPMLKFYTNNDWVKSVLYMGYNPNGTFEIGSSGNLKLYGGNDSNIELKVNGTGKGLLNGKEIATKDDVEKKVDKAQLENYQLKEAQTLKTKDKTIEGAINELKEEVDKKIQQGGGNGQIDTSKFLTKEKLSTEQIDSLDTVDKTVIGSINEINKSNSKIDDNSSSKNTTYSSSKIDELLQNKNNSGSNSLISGDGIKLENTTISVDVDNATIGFTDDGKLQAKLFTSGDEEGNAILKQYVLKDVQAYQVYEIKDEGLPINHKVIPAVFAMESGQIVTDNITSFKSVQDEDVLSNNGLRIKNEYSLSVTLLESEPISKFTFKKIIGMRGEL